MSHGLPPLNHTSSSSPPHLTVFDHLATNQENMSHGLPHLNHTSSSSPPILTVFDTLLQTKKTCDTDYPTSITHLPHLPLI
ncbi:hypothetical protein RRG08_032517 [Elysia crispata]|uniref:Uncharacterized protein n=1 Tax=Elysia crispata TaxID=231223 RepID=A0AAE0ZXB1_9GAST|nr:hypothetical protein RRG08_032517 [Elysia crispata]